MAIAQQLDYEVIPTGLSKNYVSYWSEKQALKEAFQNIAYGVTKSKQNFKAEWVNGMGVIEDFYTGFGKDMLYIGESEQRDDEQGLGSFGEGWKVFLLVMARNNRKHLVHTVGFSFYGKMEPTKHGPEVLNIYVYSNNRMIGTMVEVECEESDFYEALESFAVLQGIPEQYTLTSSIIPGRNHELWISGVRIEHSDNKNPIDLYYAYNLTNRKLINRDRSQVDVMSAYEEIKRLIGHESNEEFIRDYVKKAMAGIPYKDIQNGPDILSTNIEVWKKIIAEEHFCNWDKLVIPSDNVKVNQEVQYRGYVLSLLPQNWAFEMDWIGMKRADEVVHLPPNMTIKKPSSHQRKLLQLAKLKVKKCLRLASVKDLPPIKMVDKIEIDGFPSLGVYSREEETVYIAEETFTDLRTLTRVVLHECVHWKTGYADNTKEFTRVFEDIIMDLLGI